MQMTKWRAAALAISIMIAAAVIVVTSMAGGHSNTHSSTRSGLSPSTRSDSDIESSPASSTEPKTGPTGRPRPTYARPEGRRIFLDMLPASEADPPPDPDKPIRRVTNGIAADFGEVHVSPYESQGHYPFRISSADGTPINQMVQITGRDAQDIRLYADACSNFSRPCGSARFYCSKPACKFALAFVPSATGRRNATLLIGATPYLLTGIGLPMQEEEVSSTTSTSISKSTASTSTNSTTSTSSPSGSTVRTSSTRATTHPPASS
jgi:hypothetical protein